MSELTQLAALQAYARAINTLSAEHLEPLLALDFHYASQDVFDELETKERFLEYFRGKLETISKSDMPVWAEMGQTSYGEPCVVLAQGNIDQLVATVLTKVGGNMIKRIDICSVAPHPSTARRTGEYPN